MYQVAPPPNTPTHTLTLTTAHPPLQTIENTREKDETMVTEGDEEVDADEEADEFAGKE